MMQFESLQHVVHGMQQFGLEEIKSLKDERVLAIAVPSILAGCAVAFGIYTGWKKFASAQTSSSDNAESKPFSMAEQLAAAKNKLKTTKTIGSTTTQASAILPSTKPNTNKGIALSPAFNISELQKRVNQRAIQIAQKEQPKKEIPVSIEIPLYQPEFREYSAPSTPEEKTAPSAVEEKQEQTTPVEQGNPAVRTAPLAPTKKILKVRTVEAKGLDILEQIRNRPQLEKKEEEAKKQIKEENMAYFNKSLADWVKLYTKETSSSETTEPRDEDEWAVDYCKDNEVSQLERQPVQSVGKQVKVETTAKKAIIVQVENCDESSTQPTKKIFEKATTFREALKLQRNIADGVDEADEAEDSFSDAWMD